MNDDNDCLNYTSLYNKNTDEYFKDIYIDEYIKYKNKLFQ